MTSNLFRHPATLALNRVPAVRARLPPNPRNVLGDAFAERSHSAKLACLSCMLSPPGPARAWRHEVCDSWLCRGAWSVARA